MKVCARNMLLVGASVPIAGIALWVVVSVLASVWLAWQVPLSDVDLSQTSWLGIPTIALHFTHGPMAYTLGLMLAAAGVAAAVSSRSVVPVLVVSLILAVAYCAGLRAITRIGILDGTIKLGCYVPDTRECRQMLGMENAASYPSMYAAPEARDKAPYPVFAEAYRAQRVRVVSATVNERVVWYRIPALAMLRAPFYVFAAAELTAILEAQRIEIERLQGVALHSLGQSLG